MASRFRSLLIPVDAEGRVLLQHRPVGMDHHHARWGFFGGRIEAGETPEQALVREIKEELDLDLKKYSLFKTFQHKCKKYVFTSKLLSTKGLTVQEGDGMRFFSEKELTEITLSDNDREILAEYFRTNA